MDKKIVFIGIILLLITACNPTGKAVKDSEFLKIGGLFALTGDGASWGNPTLQAVQMALEETNAMGGVDGKQLKLIIEDTGTKPTTALTAYQKLVDLDKVQVVIGPTWDESTSAVAPMTDTDHITLVTVDTTGAVTRDKTFPYVFFTWYPEKPHASTLLQFAAKKGLKRFAMIYNQNVFATFIHDNLMEQAKAYGIEIVQEFGIPDDTKDFRTILLKTEKLSIESIFAIFTWDEYAIPFIEQAASLGLKTPIITGQETESKEILNAYQSYLPGAFYAAPHSAKGEFKQAFEKRYGIAPPTPAANAYDATKLVIAALKSGARTGPEIRHFLMNVKDFPSAAFGTLSFDEKGAVKTGEPGVFVVKTAKDGKFVEVSP